MNISRYQKRRIRFGATLSGILIAGGVMAGHWLRNQPDEAVLVSTIDAVAAPQVVAQLEQGITPAGNGEQITLNFQDVDIRALINTVSEVTGRNFIIDPRVKGKVTLVSGGPLDAAQLYDVFLSVLEVHNFSAIPSGDVVKIVPSNVVKQRPTPISPLDIRGDAQITQVYQLKYASVQELIPILRPLLPPTSHFAAHSPTNTLVFTDTAANVDRLRNIIEHVDIPDRRSNIHVVYLKYAEATELSAILSQLVASLGKPRDPKSPVSRVSVQADQAINALVISAPDNEFRLLQAVIDQLDIERPAEGDIHVVFLRFATASELVELLNQVILTERGQDKKPVTTAKVTVQADEATNALVVHASDDDFRTIKSVIEKLDVRREQVVVETIIAEVAADKAADLGVEWQVNYANTPTGQTSFNTEFTEQSGGMTLGFINDLVQNIFGEVVPDLQVVLRALRTDRSANILATPTLLTLDNEPAEIIVGQEVPFITGQFTTNVDTGTAVTTTVGDGEDGGAAVTQGIVNPFQTIERKDVGLTLQVTPQVNEGNTIRLEISQEISSVSPTTVQGASDLITDQRSIKATVQVDDGQIVVLGGLIRDDFLDTVEWVPLLGKLPLVGALFRRKSKSTVKRNLMIFLRPRIIRTGGDLDGFTKDKYEYIQERQRWGQPDTERLIPEAESPVLPDLERELQSQSQ
jgi:general secretion pathway protein D